MTIFKNKINRLTALLACSVMGLLLSVIRVLIISMRGVTSSDGHTYYLETSAEIILFWAILMLVTAAAAIAALKMAEYIFIAGKKVSTECKIVSLVCAAAFAVASLLGFALGDQTSLLLAVLISLAGIAAAARFALYGLKRIRFKSREFAWLNLALPLFYAMRMLRDFMLQTAAPFNNSGFYSLLAMASLMLFFLLEGEAAIGVKRNGLYVMCGFAAAIFIPVYSIPASLLYFSKGYGILTFAVFSFADIAAWLYVLIRLKAVLSTTKSN